jgi:hypothetical protein
MSLQNWEFVVILYFVYLAGTAAFVRMPSAQRCRAAAEAMLVVVAVVWLSRYQDGWGLQIREWAPMAYILAGYWLPGRLVSGPSLAAERRLAALDSRWFAAAAAAFVRRVPVMVLDLLEAAYLLCYPLLPLGFLCVRLGGGGADDDRFWTAVILSAALCYGTLPWLPTRPPRRWMRDSIRRSRVRALNLWILDRASVQLNTFPSGHVATSIAAALAVASSWPSAGFALGLAALGITVASVVGGYHYGADALVGIVVACIAFGLSRF